MENDTMINLPIGAGKFLGSKRNYVCYRPKRDFWRFMFWAAFAGLMMMSYLFGQQLGVSKDLRDENKNLNGLLDNVRAITIIPQKGK